VKSPIEEAVTSVEKIEERVKPPRRADHGHRATVKIVCDCQRILGWTS
jgi:hypothetical protein